ncbi:response regulator transcription factor [Corynebacterium pseudodiphtheriticum]|nr:response regulator transcription factor [Corynebacterium pseudodiphtheriticum]MDK4237208.1 response regulator transcription factor [Corynebacterium pseudodiphtheriticum]MDK4286554.1 response regulator transcription factor [Corynebacterium pseudodiphtheriticum]MDK4315933.1 response regulator transcription factor [Corynebacterium pseudodiphtheriticum]
MDTTRPITVGLADDQLLVRTGFAMVLDSQDDITVAWQADNGTVAINQAANDPVDVVLMDIQMPDTDGITATREILKIHPDTRIIVLTTFENDDYIVGAIEAGASGYLLKDSEPEDLLQAVRTVDESTAIISPKATARLLRSMRSGNAGGVASVGVDKQHRSSDNSASDDATTEPLTPRETEILQLMARGLSNQEISQELFVSMPTVKTHVTHILRKTNSRDRVQAVLYAVHHGLG